MARTFNHGITSMVFVFFVGFAVAEQKQQRIYRENDHENSVGPRRAKGISSDFDAESTSDGSSSSGTPFRNRVDLLFGDISISDNVQAAMDHVPEYPTDWKEGFLGTRAEEEEQEVIYCPLRRYVPWNLQPTYFKWIAIAGGLKMFPQHWNYIWPVNKAESTAYYAKTPVQKTALYALGYTEEDMFDCCANHYEDYDWDELLEPEYTSELQAYEMLGYDEDNWETGVDVPSSALYWNELTDEQRSLAATKLCWTELLWNQETPLGQWDIDAVLPTKM